MGEKKKRGKGEKGNRVLSDSEFPVSHFFPQDPLPAGNRLFRLRFVLKEIASLCSQ
jgi:hypothetical protein